jgi:hypothetical protein
MAHRLGHDIEQPDKVGGRSLIERKYRAGPVKERKFHCLSD